MWISHNETDTINIDNSHSIVENNEQNMKQMPIKKRPVSNWVQTERSAHEAWANLITKSPSAARLMHVFTARVGENNAVVISQRTLAKLLNCHVNTVANAIKILEAGNWVETRRIGDRGTVNAYVLNDRVAWTQPRDNLRYSLFTATVIVSDDEQPDRDELGTQEPLRRLPKVGEFQLPVGDGLPPPSQPNLPNMEPDLPASGYSYQTDIEDFTNDK